MSLLLRLFFISLDWPSFRSAPNVYFVENKIYFVFLYSSRLTGREPLMLLPGPFSSESPTGKAHMKQCEQMTLTRRQKRLCRREPGLAETLRESVRLSLLECRYQFRNERWNCSLDGRGSLLKRGTVGFSVFSCFSQLGQLCCCCCLLTFKVKAKSEAKVSLSWTPRRRRATSACLALKLRATSVYHKAKRLSAANKK